MNSEKLSPRQLAVAAMTGGLSAGAAWAGGADWRWLLMLTPAAVGLGWALLNRLDGRALHPALRALYAAWGVVLAAQALRGTAQRLWYASGGEGDFRLLFVLLAPPLLWMGWGKAAPFFRAAELLWLGTAAAVGAILLLGLPRVDWRWSAGPLGDWRQSLAAGAAVFGAGLFTLPHLYKVKREPGGRARGLAWLGSLGIVSAALALLTAGLLSPETAARLNGPFFAAAGLLGDSARLEGLVSALWLLPDLTLVGLLSRSWGESRWPAMGTLAALGLALTGLTDHLPALAGPAALLILVILTAALPPGAEK